MNKNESNLAAMALIETHSKSLNTLSWIWGGYTIDIYENRFLREHDDLDYLTLNLHDLIQEFTGVFKNCGWQALPLENGDLRLEKQGTRIHLGHVELSDRARWTHNGDKGSIWFPKEWLSTQPVRFYGQEIHVVEPEFQYVMIECPQMLNPNWKHRQKDIDARAYLKSRTNERGASLQSLLDRVSDNRTRVGGELPPSFHFVEVSKIVARHLIKARN
jgi:hypothetical protein